MPDYSDPRPVKVQIADDLRKQVASGKYAPGDKLPPVREMASRYGVVTGTVRDALDILRRECVLQTRSTRGTYVLDPEAAKAETAEEMVRRLASTLDDALHRLDKVEERLSEAEQAIRQDRR